MNKSESIEEQVADLAFGDKKDSRKLEELLQKLSRESLNGRILELNPKADRSFMDSLSLGQLRQYAVECVKLNDRMAAKEAERLFGPQDYHR